MDRYDTKKITNAIKFFKDKNVLNLGKTKLMKLLFFADKYHLQKYGKPIFNDKYFKLPYGPIPTLTLNIIDSINEKENYDLQKYTKEFLQDIEVIVNDDNQTEFRAKNDFIEDYFSESELEILRMVADKFKNINAKDISNLSHNLPEYQKSQMNEIIEYSDMAINQKDYIEFLAKEKKEFENIFI